MTKIKKVGKKILHVLAWVVIIGDILLVGMVAFWLVYPYNLPTVKEPIPIENENHVIAIGEPIKMTLIINKPQDMTPTIVAHNITCNDGNLVTLSSTGKTMPKGSYTIHSSSYVLPPKVAKGATCKFNFINTYKLNPLRSETVTWSSEEFVVRQ